VREGNNTLKVWRLVLSDPDCIAPALDVAGQLLSHVKSTLLLCCIKPVFSKRQTQLLSNCPQDCIVPVQIGPNLQDIHLSAPNQRSVLPEKLFGICFLFAKEQSHSHCSGPHCQVLVPTNSSRIQKEPLSLLFSDLDLTIPGGSN